MPRIKSAIKRVKISERNRLRNKSVKSAVNTSVKKVFTLADAHTADQTATPLDQVQEAVNKAFSRIDKAVSKGIMHKNTANRRKARLARCLAHVSGSSSTSVA
jgi:small subunit ribosomal protein S20